MNKVDEKGLAAASFSGTQCPNCKYVFADTVGLELVETDKPCPKCNEKGIREIFPGLSACKFLNMIFEFSGHDFLPAVLFPPLFEVLLVEFIKNYMRKLGLTENQINELLKMNSGVEKYLELFKSLIGKSFKEVLNGNKHVGSFYDDWFTVKEKRNKFMHGNPHSIGKTSSQKALNLSKQMFGIFIWLNNEYCCMK